ncbi:MAG: polyhydroxyalkanoic acid system family protein [Phycisphaerales bacterium]|nr:polyhydroxyalkanoic acid system family protein [Phycisphaerales bacterium]
MSHIVIHRDHALTLDEARRAAENLATQLAERYEFSHHWQNDTLHFERSGVSGQIELEPEKLRIDVRLGFLLVPLRSKLEREIHSYLDEMLQQAGPADLA